MATIVRSGNFFEITAIAADLKASEIFQDSGAHVDKKIKRMEFVAGSNNDICVVKFKDASGATITTLASNDVELVDRVYFDHGGQFINPFIDFSEGVFSPGHKLLIELA